MRPRRVLRNRIGWLRKRCIIGTALIRPRGNIALVQQCNNIRASYSFPSTRRTTPIDRDPASGSPAPRSCAGAIHPWSSPCACAAATSCTFSWTPTRQVRKELNFNGDGVEELIETYLCLRSTHGNRYSMKLFQNCLPTIIMANWMHSSLRQPAGSQMSPLRRKKSLFLTISSLQTSGGEKFRLIEEYGWGSLTRDNQRNAPWRTRCKSTNCSSSWIQRRRS